MVECLETPTAFLEAVPNAWTVTRGCLQLGVYTGAGVPRYAYGVSRGSAKCMDGNTGVPTTRGLYVLGCLETPTAFLEAVPNAWTVTRGRLQLGVYTRAGVP